MALRRHPDVPIRAYRRYFSLNSVDEVVNLLRDVFLECGANISAEIDSIKSLHRLCIESLEESKISFPNSNSNSLQANEPNLAFISIILGFIEHHLTVATSESSVTKSKTTSLNRKALLNHPLSFTPPSRSSSYNKSFHTPLSVHIEAPEEVNLNDDNQFTLLHPVTKLSPSLSTTETVCSSSTNSGQPDQISPTRRRRTSRRSRANERVRRRRLSVSSTTTDEAMEDLSMSPQNQPLQVITENGTSNKRRRFSDSTVPNPSFPRLSFEQVERLYQDFHNIITTSPKDLAVCKQCRNRPHILTVSIHYDQYISFAQAARRNSNLKPYALNNTENTTIKSSQAPIPARYATRGLISAVCEVLWSRMSANRGRERLIHTQSVYSFLSNNILDSFGLAYTTVAACQILGYQDVDLALSEDHGWIEFGPPEARQTADVASWIQESHSATMPPSSASISAADASDPTSTPASGNNDAPNPDDNGNPPPIRIPPLKHSWLYVNGYSVVCRPRILAIVAAVASIQPGASFAALNQAPASAPLAYVPDSPNFSLSSSDLLTSTDSVRHLSPSSVISKQLVNLKTRLLWLCFDAGLLNRYPLGLTNLGDLEDAFPTMERLATFLNTKPQQHISTTTNSDLKTDTHVNDLVVHKSDDHQIQSDLFGDSNSPKVAVSETAYLALALYRKAVAVDRVFYANQHVYPYTCLAGCLYRHGDLRGALKFWAEAARVIGHYNHTTEDWEVYRELLDIATHLMPQMFRSASEDYRSCSEGLVDSDPDGCLYQPSNILDDPRCLAYLLIFYDHLCLWEEGSPVPVLHVGWVDKLMLNLTRFSERARKYLRLSAASQEDDTKTVETEVEEASTRSADTIGSTRRTTGRTRSNSGVTNVRSSVSSTKEANLNRINQLQAVSIHSPIITCAVPLTSPKVEDELTTGSEQESIASSKTQTDASVLEISTKTSNPPAKRKSTRLRKSSRTSQQTIPEYHDSNPEITTNEPYPSGITINHTKPPLPEVVAALADLNPDQDSKSEQMADIEDQDGSPSPPLIDFPNHEDLLASLAEACDHRLLNPAFLWGVEPNAPFLPPNTAPETLERLMTSLDTKEFINLNNPIPQPTSVQNLSRHDLHLFPTPPNSGSLSSSIEPSSVNDELVGPIYKQEVKGGDHLIDLSASNQVPTVVGQTHMPVLNQEPEVPVKSNNDPTAVTDDFFPEPFDTVDGFLEDMENDLIDSVVEFEELKPDEANGSTTSCPNEFLDFMLEVESRSNIKNIKQEQPSNQSSDLVHPRTKPKDPTVHLTIYSIKMCSIIELLRARRLDSSAIKLALTAQSQVCLRRSGLTPSQFL